MQRAAATRPRIRWRTLALPNEHGAWAFLLEPALLGLGVAPSAAGLALVGAGLAALLWQHPLGLALADVGRRKRYPRTLPAFGVAGAYAVLAAAMVAAAFLAGARPAALWPLAAARPVALLQLAYDARNRGRDLRAEVAGTVALGALAAAIVLAAGGAWPPALGLWLVAAARNAPSILYVRARLRLQRGASAARGPALAAHVAGLVVISAAVLLRALPWPTLLPFTLLLVRAAAGMRAGAPVLQAKRVGMLELGYGLVTVAVVVTGAWVGW